MVSPVSGPLPVDLLLQSTPGSTPAAEVDPTRPVREPDSATISPEALEMLRASQADDGG
ncbi:MAG: hypothetical protein AAF957_21010 [Planctomycetota bacterium]